MVPSFSTLCLDTDKISQAAMNMAAITGPMTNPLRPKCCDPAQRGDKHNVVGHLCVFAHQDRTQEVIHEANDERAERDQNQRPAK